MKKDPVEERKELKDKLTKQYKAALIDREGAAAKVQGLKDKKERATAMAEWVEAAGKVHAMEEAMPWLKNQ
jgi:hypothetical protein